MSYPERVQNLKKNFNRILVDLPDAGHFQLSENTFYVTFLSVSMLITFLLFGASLTPAPVPIDPNQPSLAEIRLERDVQKMVAGYPIEGMMPYIVKQDKYTAAFLVGIAKKESNWGKRVPRTASGEDCFNYWGYRGAGSRGKAMGHGCFGSQEEAVTVISKRLDTFIEDYRFDTAAELVVWKCGFSCAGHTSVSVNKWIADVGFYADQIKN